MPGNRPTGLWGQQNQPVRWIMAPRYWNKLQNAVKGLDVSRTGCKDVSNKSRCTLVQLLIAAGYVTSRPECVEDVETSEIGSIPP